MPIPLYGFLQGDTVALIIFAEPEDSMLVLAHKLIKAARPRVAVATESALHVLWQGRPTESGQSVASLEPKPLDRFDVRIGVRSGVLSGPAVPGA